LGIEEKILNPTMTTAQRPHSANGRNPKIRSNFQLSNWPNVSIFLQAPMKTIHLFNSRCRHPRRNLPVEVNRKRGESNFVSAFTKAYIASIARHGIGTNEFALSGFGIADFIWLAWRHSANSDDGTALSVKKIKSRRTWQKLTAFEMKLTDWRKGFGQAYRYSYFADLAIVVLPPDTAKTAEADLKLFRKLSVGLWSFDKTSGKIRKIFTPRHSKPRNAKAKEKALESLGRSLKFSKFVK
jgi:hypothetical protein